MTFAIIALVLLAVCLGLLRASEQFKVDASPVGSMMILVGLGLGVCSVFFAGVALGQFL